MRAAAVALTAFAPLQADAATLERIRETGHIRLGFLEDAPPFSFRRGDGTPQGYAVELCQKVVAQLERDLALPGLTSDWVPVAFEKRFSDVKKGRIDLLCAPAIETSSRRQDASFSIPIFASGNRAAVRADAPESLRNLLSESVSTKPVWHGSPAWMTLESTRFAIVPGTTGEKWFSESSATLPVKVRRVSMPDYTQALQQLAAGSVDVVLGDRVVMLGTLQGLPPAARAKVEILDRMFTHESAALVLNHGDDDFRALVDRSLSRMYVSAEFAALYSKWCGQFDERARTFFLWNTLPE